MPTLLILTLLMLSLLMLMLRQLELEAVDEAVVVVVFAVEAMVAVSVYLRRCRRLSSLEEEQCFSYCYCVYWYPFSSVS
jgi:hypothetical protein